MLCVYEDRIKIFHVIEMRVVFELGMMLAVAYFVVPSFFSATKFKLYMLHCILQCVRAGAWGIGSNGGGSDRTHG
jgi:hypothetical protein